jgi:hypothetical protein
MPASRGRAVGSRTGLCLRAPNAPRAFMPNPEMAWDRACSTRLPSQMQEGRVGLVAEVASALR